MPAKPETRGVATPTDAALASPPNDPLGSFYPLPFEGLGAWINFLKAYKVVVDNVDREVVTGSPITLAEYELLLYVDLAGGRIRFIDLSRLTLLSQSQISRRIDSLQAKAYLSRESTNTDRRATYAVMTPAGYDAFQASQSPFARSFQKNFLSLIPPEDLATFSRVLEILIQDPSYRQTTAEILDQASAANSRG